MAFGKNPTTTTQTTLANNQFPLSTVAVPNHAGGDLTALRGANASTDTNGNELADASMAVPDGGDVTQGAQADTAATSGTGSWSAIALLKGILTKLLGTIAVSGTFWQATQPVSGTVTANAGTNLNTSLLTLESGHVANVDTSNAAINTATGAKADGAASDSTSAWSVIALLKGIFAKLAGTLTVSGAITANAGTNLNTSALALEAGHLATIDTNTAASKTDLDTIVTNTANIPSKSATSTPTNVGGSATSAALLASNASRKGMYVYNDSTSALYIMYGAIASATAFTVKIGSQGFFEMPTSPVYTGAINGIWDTATGSARVTELT